ncbi:MAG: sensor histidine kinase, partial [Owenweeksia sp.]
LLVQILVVAFLTTGFILSNNRIIEGPGILEDGDPKGFKMIMELLTFVWLSANFIYFNFTTRDAEQRLNQAMTRVTRANKEMEEFVYIASHDLQEPLRTVQSFGQLLEEENTGLSQDQTTYLGFIKRSTQRMQNLIEALMKHTRLGLNKEKEPVDLSVLIKEVQEDLALTIKETDTTIHIEDLPVVMGLPTELRLLFQNLVSNGIKFQPSSHKPQIWIYRERTAEEKEKYTICVRDNGIGIKSQYLDKIFAMFRRLNSKDAFSGSGIGLAHCRKIADLHDGEIKVTSKPGEGSTFYVTLPKYESKQ